MAGIPKEFPPDHLQGEERLRWLANRRNQRAHAKRLREGLVRRSITVPAHRWDELRAIAKGMCEEFEQN